MKIFIIFVLTQMLCCGVSSADSTQQNLAPGYSPLAFTAPTPGSYQLPVLEPATDGKVVDSDNRDLQLHDLLGDKVVVLSFVYSTCSDVNGCPLATAVLHKINSRLQTEPEIAAKLRLLTLSFNPEHDTPEQMWHFGKGFQGNAVDWRFLTTRSDVELQPLLQHYPQNVQKIYDAKGRFTGTFNHNLRVYLIDQHKQIRNIYNSTFLHADTLINDIKTLLQNVPTPPKAQAIVLGEQRLHAGDDKSGYAEKDYQTHSLALTARQGKALDLWQVVQEQQLGLPNPPVPKHNPLTAEKIQLGRKLFYDRRLSFNNTFSCATCHIPEQGFSSNEMATSVGIEGRSVRRNAPTLYNVAYAEHLFHDGREDSLEQQVWGPLLAHNEMGNPSIAVVINKIKQSPDYAGLFEQSFAKPVSMESVGMALASYQRTLNSGGSAFDRWYFGKQEHALSAAAQRGFALFTGKAGCAQCHLIASQQALFMDQKLHNTGIGYAESMTPVPEKRKLQVAPGTFVEVDNSALNSVVDRKVNDLGQYEISQNPADRWKYKTPSLRNISLTAPYMHNGSLSSLADVVAFYNQGGVANENLDPMLKPLHLNAAEQQDLVVFLQSLSGSNVEALVTDAFAAPMGDQ